MTMICDLPHDLESEILSRVPAKSLTRFKTTCKRWYALFRDPRFIEKNKKLGGSERESILLTNHGDAFSVSGDLHSTRVNRPIEVSGKLTSLKGSKKDLDVSTIFHCDGLMLCSTEENTRLVVWNPCTGQRTKIKPRTSYGYKETFALGYSTSSSGRSYKILSYWRYPNKEKCEIYDLSSDSWRVLDSFTRDHSIYFNGVSFKGDTYFVARNEESGFFLMKFDFTTETFVRLPLPIPTERYVRRCVLSVVRDEKLSLLQIYYDDLSYLRSEVLRICVSNKIDDDDANKDLSWRSDLVLEVDFNSFNMYTYFESFLLDEENKVALLCCDVGLEGDVDYTTIVYIIGKDVLKQVYRGTEMPSRPNLPRVITYVPNLVRIQINGG